MLTWEQQLSAAATCGPVWVPQGQPPSPPPEAGQPPSQRSLHTCAAALRASVTTLGLSAGGTRRWLRAWAPGHDVRAGAHAGDIPVIKSSHTSTFSWSCCFILHSRQKLTVSNRRF